MLKTWTAAALVGALAMGVAACGSDDNSSTGSSTTNRAPVPGPSLSAAIVPSCSSTNALQIASPSPSPPNRRAVAPAPCSNA